MKWQEVRLNFFYWTFHAFGRVGVAERRLHAFPRGDMLAVNLHELQLTSRDWIQNLLYAKRY